MTVSEMGNWKYIVWIDYRYEGWSPRQLDRLEDLPSLLSGCSCSSYMVTKPVVISIAEKEAK